MAAGVAPTDLIELGVVRGAYGIKGWLRIAPHAPEAAVLASTNQWWLQGDGAPQPVEVTAAKRHGASLLAKWASCDSKEAADAFKGKRVAVARGEFPATAPGEMYWVDLLGARVINRAGIELGHVSGMKNNGAHDLLEVKGATLSLLVPLVEQFIDEIDTEARIVRVDWEADW